MRIKRIEDVSVWRPGDFDLGKLEIELGPREVGELCRSLDAVNARGVELESVQFADFATAAIVALMERIEADTMRGRGLVILAGFPVEEHSQQDIEKIYWGVSQALGRPVSQSVLGDRMGHLISVFDIDPNARGYRNKYALAAHTDMQDVLSYLSLSPAAEGGQSWFVNAHAIHNDLYDTRSDLLEILYRGFPWHRFGEEQPGEAPVTPYRVPIFSERDGLVSCRYSRRYLDLVDLNTDSSYTDHEREALDTLDRMLASEEYGMAVDLDPGDAVYLNNYVLMHGRSAFEDDAAAGTKRHLLRLWLVPESPRPVVDEIFWFESERRGEGIARKAGHVPSFEHADTVS